MYVVIHFCTFFHFEWIKTSHFFIRIKLPFVFRSFCFLLNIHCCRPACRQSQREGDMWTVNGHSKGAMMWLYYLQKQMWGDLGLIVKSTNVFIYIHIAPPPRFGLVKRVPHLVVLFGTMSKGLGGTLFFTWVHDPSLWTKAFSLFHFAQQPAPHTRIWPHTMHCNGFINVHLLLLASTRV